MLILNFTHPLTDEHKAQIESLVGPFPTLIRMRPKQGPLTSFEVAELPNLQTIRGTARTHR